MNLKQRLNSYGIFKHAVKLLILVYNEYKLFFGKIHRNYLIPNVLNLNVQISEANKILEILFILFIYYRQFIKEIKRCKSIADIKNKIN